MRHWRRAALLGALILAMAAGGTPLHAQPLEFGISPPEIELLPAPGATASGVLLVYNKTTRPVRFRARLQDLYLRPSGEVEVLAPGRLAWSVAPLARVVPAEFDLPPDRMIPVRVSVTVPGDLRGGRYGVVVVAAAPTLQAGARGGTIAVLMPQLAARLLVAIRGTEVVDGSIVNMLAAARPGGRGADVRVVFRNAGNVHVRARGEIAFLDVAGRRLDALPLAPSLVLPGTAREFKVAWPRTLAPGSYTARAVIDYGGDVLVSGEIGFDVRR